VVGRRREITRNFKTSKQAAEWVKAQVGITHYTSQGSGVGDTETTWAMGATDSFSQEAGQVVFFRSFFRSP
jgi:hypothetical protein